ncbi:MAG: hypothetical protein HFI89_11940 [Lachnospiraceae bacterium]|nr:hypothetical protein [Lachnospiraceae bacterium]
MKLLHEKIVSIRIYILAGAILCGMFLQHRKDDFSRVFYPECMSYDNVTDILPRLSLSAGTYTVSLEVEAEGTVPEAVFQVYSEEQGSVLTTPINNMSADFSYAFQLEEPSNDVLFRIVYAGYDGSEAERVEVAAMIVSGDRPLSRDALLCMLLFLVLYVAWGLYYFRGKTAAKEEGLYGALVCLAVAFSSYPLMKGYLINGHDLAFHLARVEGIKDGLLCGQFPVRIHPPHLNGYGYGTAALYPELFLYIPALLRLMGVSAVAAFSFFLFLVNLSTALIMYDAVKSMTHSSYYAALAFVVYTLSIYRFSCVYQRAALGEALALCFLPLAVSGMYHVLLGDPRKWSRLVMGATGIFQSHLISTLLTALLAVYLGLAYFRNLFVDRRWLALLKSIGVLLLLNLWFLVPFFDFYRLDLNLNAAENLFYEQAVIPAQLFCLLGDEIGVSHPLENGIRWEMSITLGISVSLCMLGCIWLFFYRKKGKGSFGRKLFWFGAGCLLCSTTLVPWNRLEKLIVLDTLTRTVQFPWRLLGPATAMAVMALADAGAREYSGGERAQEKKLVMAALVCAGIYSCISLGGGLLQSSEPCLRRLQSVRIDNSALGQNKEYLIYGTDEGQLTADRYLTSADSVQVLERQKKGTTVTVTYTNGGNDGWIEVPLLWYPGYKAKELRTGEELLVQAGDNHVLRVIVPSGRTGSFRVSYVGRGRYHGAEAVSLLTFQFCVGGFVFRRRKGMLQSIRKSAASL